MATNTDKTIQSSVDNEVSDTWRMLMRSERFKIFLKTALLKNILHYEQSINQILSGTSIRVLFTSFTSMFNVSFASFNASNDNSWCFIKGMTAKQKIVIDLMTVLMIFLIILLYYAFTTCISKTPLQIRTRKVKYKKVFIAGILMTIGKILDVLFRLLNCQLVGDVSVHFYFAIEHCYGTTWIIALLSLLLIMIIFSVGFIKIKRMKMSERQKQSGTVFILTNKYKPQYYYWEMYYLFEELLSHYLLSQ